MSKLSVCENTIERYVRQNPEATVEALLLRFPGADAWTVRQIRRDVRRSLAGAEIQEIDGALDTPLALSKNAQTLLRAGFFRPIKVELKDRRTAKPIFKKAGHQILVLPDIHAPDEDQHALDVAIQVGQAVGVDRVILPGDGMDCHSVSKYVPAAHRPYRWVDERSLAVPVLQNIREQFKNVPVTYLFGNHCRRPEDFIARVAPQLQGLMTLPELLGIDQLGFEFEEDNRVILANNQLMIKHGVRVRGEAGVSVQQEVKAAGMSVIMAHVHRRALYELTRTAQVIRGDQPLLGVEPGCLCNLDPDYKEKEETANWQHGAAIVTLHDNDTFDVEIVRIHKGLAYFRGLQFRSRYLPDG